MITLTLLAALAALAAAGSHDRVALDSLADATARDIARFADRRAAVAAGYRRVGTDFPGMGEHWVHPAALVAGTIDARRPTMLSYATIAGRYTLLGAGFIVRTSGDERADVPGWPAHWHEHSGLLAEASGVRSSARPTDQTSTHIWILHIWTALPNPSGRYDADNWALPFARAGISAPLSIDHDAGQAAGLAVGAGDAYLRSALTVTGLRTSRNEGRVDAEISIATGAAAMVLQRSRDGGTLTATNADDLRRIWSSLRDRLRALIGPEVESLLRPPAAHVHSPDQGARMTAASRTSASVRVPESAITVLSSDLSSLSTLATPSSPNAPSPHR